MDEFPNFSINPQEAFKIIHNFTPLIFLAAFTLSGSNLSSVALRNASYCVSSSEWFPVFFVQVRVCINCWSNVIKHQAGVCDFDKLNDALIKVLKQ